MTVRLKVSVEKDGVQRTHRIRIDDPKLEDISCRCFEWLPTSQRELSYLDADGDKIVIGDSPEEWAECLSVFRDSDAKVLVLTLRHVGDLSAKSDLSDQTPTAPPPCEMTFDPNCDVAVPTAPESPKFQFTSLAFQRVVEELFGHDAVQRAMSNPPTTGPLFGGCAVIDNNNIAIPTEDFPLEVLTHTSVETTSAIDIIQQALDVVPGDRNLWYELAVLQSQDNDTAAAKRSIQIAVECGCPIGKVETDERVRHLMEQPKEAEMVVTSQHDPYGGQKEFLQTMGYNDTDRCLEATGGNIEATMRLMDAREKHLLDKEDELYSMGYTDASTNLMLLQSCDVDTAAALQPALPKSSYSDDY